MQQLPFSNPTHQYVIHEWSPMLLTLHTVQFYFNLQNLTKLLIRLVKLDLISAKKLVYNVKVGSRTTTNILDSILHLLSKLKKLIQNLVVQKRTAFEWIHKL